MENSLKNMLFNKYYSLLFMFPFIAGFVLFYYKSSFSICLLMNLTEQPCPFCGMSRSFSSLMHFHIAESISYNFLIILYAPILILLMIINLIPNKNKIKLFLGLLYRLKLINIIAALIICATILFGFVRIMDSFFHFINFKNIVPDVTVLKLVRNF